ncbi:hypothetical protein ACF07B_24940 [Streptomyces sp. NPDC015532]|uniref:hypothetical protein n=1 Tax=Streptomyces sp. NPDC015532 TaxID=3364960 RepID=UPI003700F5E7
MTRRRRAAGLLAVLISGAAMTQTACAGRTPSGRPPVSYDAAVRSDSPALYLPLGAGNTEKRSTAALKVTDHHEPGVASLPNGDRARLSWLGKASPGEGRTEWLARMYSEDNTEVRANRISGYVFNRGGGLGAGSYFEDRVEPGEWIHYALVINIREKSDTYPTGYVKIYKNGVLRDQDALDAYDIAPSNTDAPLRIGSSTPGRTSRARSAKWPCTTPRCPSPGSRPTAAP